MRVLIEVDNSDIRIGAVNDVLDLCRYGHSSDVDFYLCGKVDEVLRSAAQDVGFKVLNGASRQIGKRDIVLYIASVVQWLWVLIKLKPNIVHLNYVSWGASLACAAKIMRIGLVSRSGGEYSTKNLSCRWIDCYVANCEAQAANLLNSPIKGKVRIVGDLINMDRFNIKYNDSVLIPPKIEGVPRILFLGQLVERKGIDVLVRAFSMLKNPAELFLVGGDWSQGGYPEIVKKTIIEFGLEYKIKLINYCPDAIYFLNNCDIFVLPSLSEARPRSIIEAMLMGKCIVSTNVGGIPTLIQNGVTGQLVPPDDSQALADALEIVCNSVKDRNRFGRLAKECALRTFDINSTVNRYLQAYREVAGLT